MSPTSQAYQKRKPEPEQVGPPVLNDEQRARKTHLLSRFRYFAAAWQGGYYHAQPHDEMCDELDECTPDPGEGTQRKKVYLAPRYTYKTSLLIAFMAYLILKWMDAGRDIAIDYVRSDYELASEVLYELKQSLETIPFIVELWGDLRGQANLWSENKINLGRRRDPTVNVAGLNRGTAGKHPDIVIADDMVNEKNFESIKAKRQARNKVQAYSPVLPPWGSMIVCGTRFAHNDVYGWILDKNAKDARDHVRLMEEAVAIVEGAARVKAIKAASAVKPQWTEYIRSVIDAKGNHFFPDVLTEAFLDQQKRSIEAKFYAAWYLNRPDIEGMVRFRLEYLEKAYFTASYSRWPIPLLEIMPENSTHAVAEIPVRLTMTLDPTVTANGTSDYTGMTLVATDADDNWWVLFARRYLEVPSKVGEIAAEHIRKYKPEVLLIESANADVDMVKRIQRAISEENIPTRITSYHPLRDETGGSVGRPGRRKKSARIEALEPRFRNGKIFLARNTCEALYEQYKGWPDIENDDVFDALAMQYGLAKPCVYKSLREAEREYEGEDDPEMEGRLFGGTLTQTMRRRDGSEMTVNVPLPDRGDPDRLIGRSGTSSQRLRLG